MPPDSPPSPGNKKLVRLGKYEVVGHIATGGMGKIFRAHDTQMNREVALKILPPDMAAKPAMVVRFRREYAAASKMRHENIVELYELGELNETLYFAMEFVEGIDLHEHVRQAGPLDPEEARQIVLQGARALRHAAQHGIVHRDVKPSNFLLTTRGGRPHVKLTDFGLAREVSDDHYRVTRAGTTVGTIDYMAPEQAKDSGSADIRSDLYALGSTWYHLLTGQSPFPDGGLGQRLIQIMNEPPPDVRELNPLVSDETAALLGRLLEKDPDDRPQTPEELIDDLLALQGKATAPPKPRPAAKKPKKRAEVEEEAPAAKSEDYTVYIVGGAVALLAVVAALVLLMQPRRPQPDDPEKVPPPVVVPGGVTPRDPPEGVAKKDGPGKDGAKVAAPKEKLPTLYRLVGDPAKLRAEVEKPWADDGPAEGEVRRVRRVAAAAGTVRSLADAAAAGGDGPLLIEVHDAGPLFLTPVAVAGRDVTIRAGGGFRPLIVWDVPATVEKRRADKKLDEPLAFVSVSKGSLTLEGLEVVWSCPETLVEPLTLAAVSGGEVRFRDCTFSGAGRPREPVTLLRLKADRPGARVRLDRCHARAAGLTALDVTAPGAEVLIDGSLLSSSHATLLRLRGKEKPATNLRVVRSTLVSGKRLIEYGPLDGVRRPGLSVLAWDAVLAHAGSGEGELLALDAGADAVEWTAMNAVYAGWPHLLSAAGKTIDDLAGWRGQWVRTDGDAAVSDPWPDDEPGARPAAANAPSGPARFAATVDPEKPLGCDLAALPRARDGWLSTALEPSLTVPEPVGDAAPEVPNPGGPLFHGGRLDLNDGTDLGAFLASRKLGPRVVLHLSGKGEKATSPIRVRGSTLVLFFEEPADKDPRLSLTGAAGGEGGVIDVEGGGLDVIGGVVRAPDVSSSAYSHVVRVRGGPLRLTRTRVEGPTQLSPEGYAGAVSFAGSGETGPDKALPCALDECVLLSSRAGLIVEGVGGRTLVRGSLVVAAEALAIQPGPGCKGDANQQVTAERTTLAFRRAAVALGDAGPGDVSGPVALRTRDCALLCPFQSKPTKSGLVRYEGDSFLRGLLVWHGERDAVDARMHFAAWPAGTATPDVREPAGAWRRVVGSYGLRSPRPDLIGLRVLDGKPWHLERLTLPGREPAGANLPRLGIAVKK